MSAEAGIIAEVVFRSLMYIVGCLGNLLVIFFILMLREHKKITHWYVLQLALADFVFLQTLPFRISEVLHEDWIFPVWACQAKQTVFFFNYYSSIIFLMIMAVDRYLAVCHSFSTAVQKLRSNKSVCVVTACFWSISLLLCIPVMMYSDTSGVGQCNCVLSFPLDAKILCQQINDESQRCLEFYSTLPSCYRSSSTENGNEEENSHSGASEDYTPPANLNDTEISYDENYDYDYEGENAETIQPSCQFPPEHPGMYTFVYFNFIAMFLFPLLVIAICYFLIAVRLSRSLATGPRKTSSNDSSGTERNTHNGKVARSKSVVSAKSQREKKRVTVMCVVLVSLFVVCWLPFHAVNVALVEGIKHQSTETCASLSKFAAVFAYLNSALNPYLYNFLGSFKKKLRQVSRTDTMQSFLSATGMTRVGRRTSDNVSSSTGYNSSSRTRRNTAQNAHSIIPEEAIPLEERQKS